MTEFFLSSQLWCSLPRLRSIFGLCRLAMIPAVIPNSMHSLKSSSLLILNETRPMPEAPTLRNQTWHVTGELSAPGVHLLISSLVVIGAMQEVSSPAGKQGDWRVST
jgi:hypothetical protein